MQALTPKIKPPYVSERGLPLMYQQTHEGTPVITVENYEKWYNLYVLHPDGSVTTVPSDLILELDEGGQWIDHIWHPKLVQLVAKHYGGEVPATTLELIAGRWVIERGLHADMSYYLDDEETG